MSIHLCGILTTTKILLKSLIVNPGKGHQAILAPSSRALRHNGVFAWYAQDYVAPDGERFLVAENTRPPQINIITNWFEELKRILPTK